MLILLLKEHTHHTTILHPRLATTAECCSHTSVLAWDFDSAISPVAQYGYNGRTLSELTGRNAYTQFPSIVNGMR